MSQEKLPTYLGPRAGYHSYTSGGFASNVNLSPQGQYFQKINLEMGDRRTGNDLQKLLKELEEDIDAGRIDFNKEPRY